MGEQTLIAWCHHTINFWYGCVEVSPACGGPKGPGICYAKMHADIRYHLVEWDGERRRSTLPVRRAPYKWDRDAAASGVRRRVFCISLGDFFDNQVPTEWRAEAWDTIRECHHLDWIILTKRPQNIRRMLPPDWGDGWRNVWLGATVENMTEARRRIPVLLRIPAPIHWLSCEPLFEQLDVRAWLGRGKIDWVLVGGQTGANAQFTEPDWMRDLLQQCRDAGAAFFLIQMTRRKTIPDDLLVREIPAA